MYKVMFLIFAILLETSEDNRFVQWLSPIERNVQNPLKFANLFQMYCVFSQRAFYDPSHFSLLNSLL